MACCQRPLVLCRHLPASLSVFMNMIFNANATIRNAESGSQSAPTISKPLFHSAHSAAGKSKQCETMKKPTEAIENLTHSQRQLDRDGSEVGVSRQALEETMEWANWAYTRIMKLEKEVDDLENELVHGTDDDEDDFEPKGDQW